MSTDDKSFTSVLLPSARVTLFTRDSATRDAFLALESDWRFARVELRSVDGDVEDAISLYQAQPSPDMVIVQTETIDATFPPRLEALGGACAEGTAAAVIGPVNDVNLYRRMVGMGISDYLVKPVHTDFLGNTIAATLINRIGATGSRLFALMGAKGGVGTTSLAEALAWGSAEVLGQKTFLMDAAGGWSTLSVGLNFEPTTTLAEAARAANEGNNDSLTRMMFSASDKLTVLSSGGDVMLDDPVDAVQYESLLDTLMTTYPVVIVDLSGGSAAALRRIVLARAHEIMLVTAPTLPSVRATRALIKEIKDIRGGSEDATHVIVNMTGLTSKYEVSKAQIEQGLECKPAVFIPFDPELFVSAESEARKMTSTKEGRGIVDKLMPLMRRVLSTTGSESAATADEDARDRKGGIGGLLTKLKSKS